MCVLSQLSVYIEALQDLLSKAYLLTLQVTVDNFERTLPEFARALQECHFVSVDCEMTGLFLENTLHSYLDDMHARYAKVRSTSSVAFACRRLATMVLHKRRSAGTLVRSIPEISAFVALCFVGSSTVVHFNSQVVQFIEGE
jgi:hypothetical protein